MALMVKIIFIVPQEEDIGLTNNIVTAIQCNTIKKHKYPTLVINPPQ